MTIGMVVSVVFGVLILVVGTGVLIYGFVNDEVDGLRDYNFETMPETRTETEQR